MKNSNPVLLARHFQRHVETFFKEILLMPLSTIRKVTYYAIRIEFQGRDSPHVHSFIWILNQRKLSEETLGMHIEFIDNIIHANLPAPDDDPVPYELVTSIKHINTYKVIENIKISYAGMGLVNFSRKKQLLHNH